MTKLSKTFHRIFSPSRRRGEKGFTLIELLVVVGILGVLAGVVTLSVGQFIGEGASEADITELHNVQTAVVAFQAQNSGTAPAVTGGSGCGTLVSEGYILSEPTRATYTWDTEGVVTQTLL